MSLTARRGECIAITLTRMPGDAAGTGGLALFIRPGSATAAQRGLFRHETLSDAWFRASVHYEDLRLEDVDT